MSDLDAAIRARLDALADWDDITLMHAALTAALDVHKRYEQHHKSVCGECVYTQGGDNVDWPCPTVRAIAEKLGVETGDTANGAATDGASHG